MEKERIVMTHAKTPWSTRIYGTLGKGVEIIDANGNSIAFFRDARDAEFVVELIRARFESRGNLKYPGLQNPIPYNRF